MFSNLTGLLQSPLGSHLFIRKNGRLADQLELELMMRGRWDLAIGMTSMGKSLIAQPLQMIKFHQMIGRTIL